MKYEYKIREDVITDEEGELHTVFGIEAWCGKELVRTISDVFYQQKNAEHYIELFNKLNLSIIHLEDVIEDIL